MLLNCCYSKATWYYELSPTILFTHVFWSHTWGKTCNEDRDTHQDGIYLYVDITVRYYPNMTLCHDPTLWVPLTYVYRVGNYVILSESKDLQSKDLQVTRFGSRISVCVCVCVCLCLPGLATQLFYFMTTWHQLIKTEKDALHEVVQIFHQSVIYCQNVIRLNDTRLNVISQKPLSKLRPSLGQFSWNSYTLNSITGRFLTPSYFKIG